jgi:hypothetical protein
MKASLELPKIINSGKSVVFEVLETVSVNRMTLYYCDFSNIIVQFEPLLINPRQIIPFL